MLLVIKALAVRGWLRRAGAASHPVRDLVLIACIRHELVESRGRGGGGPRLRPPPNIWFACIPGNSSHSIRPTEH